jgi:phenylacetyl-CoA:acceptor oxidoreductase subunit 2
MKPSAIRAAHLAAPKQQRNWDWRAAANFIAGGAGGGLLLFNALVSVHPGVIRAAILLGLLLIGAGLTCVWFEIGRPWRALNVYRHFATSWMTREAFAALVLFPLGALALLTLHPGLVFATGILGLAFLYCQARILAANKGIPTWRHPRSAGLMVATGLAEGAGFLACVAALSPVPMGPVALLLLVVLVAVRAWFWRRYLAALRAEGAPAAALRVLDGFAGRFVVIGHVVPALFAALALAGLPLQAGLVFAAGAITVGGGWSLKYTLVRRAAFTQGLALQHQPARGAGPTGPAAKPGWNIAAGT